MKKLELKEKMEMNIRSKDLKKKTLGRGFWTYWNNYLEYYVKYFSKNALVSVGR